MDIASKAKQNNLFSQRSVQNVRQDPPTRQWDNKQDKYEKSSSASSHKAHDPAFKSSWYENYKMTQGYLAMPEMLTIIKTKTTPKVK